MRPLFSATVSAIVVSILCLGSSALAAEDDFLTSFDGSWTGKGTVTTRIGAKPINVNCSIDFDSNANSLRMNGACRGLVVVRRAISADIRTSGSRYSGTYTGPSGQPSSLSGSRRGSAINLNVRWAKVTNGDRSAAMSIQKLGDKRIRLQTVDKDPASGKSVVTSQIDLSR